MQGGCDRRAVRKTIGRDLKWRPRRRMAQAFHEDIGRLLFALAHRDVQHKLAVTRDPHKHIAVAEQPTIFGPDTLLFPSDVGPHLVTFAVADLDVTDLLGHNALALPAD